MERGQTYILYLYRPIIRNMTKRLVLASVLILVISSAQAQFDTSFIKKNIQECSDSLVNGFKTRNWKKFTRYSYPAIVASLGGAREFSEYIGNMFSQLPDSAWKKYETGKILQIIKTEGDYQAIIELKSIIEFEGTRTIATSYLIGESWDGGLFWTFFDSQGDRSASKQIKPDLDDKLFLPEKDEKREPIKR